MSETQVLTGKVRFSYVNVWTPRALQPGDTPKYSVCILIPKSDTETINAIKAAINAAAAKGVIEKWGGSSPKNVKHPLKDGDAKNPPDPAFAGHMYINASSKRKPGVVDYPNVNDIIDQSQFYSGCYGRAHLNFFAYAAPGNKGVGAGLNHIQKMEDGEPLAGGVSAQEAFGAPVDGAAAAKQGGLDSFFNQPAPQKNKQPDETDLISF